MSLKVIGGVYGGRVLRSVRGLGTRPLLGQVKAAVFNVLGESIDDAVVWDLFAGTGATGIEALSRGAREVVFVEKANKAIEVLRQNLEMLGDDAVARGRVVRGDAWEPQLEGLDAPDVVFLDPPYTAVLEDPVKSIYRARRLVLHVAPGGCVVFHFETGAVDEDDFDGDLTVDLREWGNSAIAFLWRADEAPERVRRKQRTAEAEEQ